MPGMGQLAGDKVQGQARQAICPLLIGERIFACVEPRQALMDVHPRSVDAGDRFGHEGGNAFRVAGLSPSGWLEGDHVVGGAQSIGIAKVDLVLPMAAS